MSRKDAAPEVRRACACGGSCSRCLGGSRAGGTGGSAGGSADGVADVLRSPGQPLDGATRARMEDRLGGDFGNVRLHTDGKAADAATRMGARAFTFGQHVGFAAHRYSPETRAGASLLAHELVHVMQQGTADPWRTSRFEIGPADGPLEAEAHAIAEERHAAHVRHPYLSRTP